MNIRLAEKKDAEAIANLHADSWRIAYRGMFRDAYLDGDVYGDRRSLWRQRLSNPGLGQLILVAEAAREIDGFICAYGCEDSRFGTLIDNLHVRLDRQRQGIGRQLLREVVQWSLKEYPDIGVYLNVLEANQPARKFYESLGATNYDSMLWQPPGGGEVVNLRYVWSEPGILLRNTV